MIQYQPVTTLMSGVSPILSVVPLAAAALSNQGRRSSNQDTVLHHVTHTLQGDPLGLFIICDGMGGYEAGDVASKMAVRTVGMELAPVLAAAADMPIEKLNYLIHRAISTANHKIWHYAQNLPEKKLRMGTTMTLALVVGERLHVANVGDSRAYLYRRGQLCQLTRDHSLVADLAEHVTMSSEDQARHPYRNILTRALGRQETVEVDQMVETLQLGDRLLLCTDGLWKAFLTSQELSQQLGTRMELQEQCQALVAAAVQRDNSDNITVIVAHYDYDYPTLTKHPPFGTKPHITSA